MNNKITYRKEGDYLIPNLAVPNDKNKDYHIGKYGHLRLKYLKEHKKGFYNELMLSETLPEYLANIDKEAYNQVSCIIKQLAKAECIDEKLKQTNQMEWIQAMNNIKNRAEEFVFNEIIYV